MKKYNFNAGPSALPNEVFKYSSEAIKELDKTGLSLLEISHRSNEFSEIITRAKDLALKISNLDQDEYEVLFLQGGASHQYLMVASNFLNNVAGYINTGTWSEKAMAEAKFYGNVIEVASSKDRNHTYIPNNVQVLDSLDYLHITSNNTIFGTQFHSFPESNCPLFADMSSDIFSRKIDFSKFDLIYAGAQKNLGPAGATMVMINKELLDKVQRNVPSMLSYKVHIEKDSSFNTPPVFPIYCILLNLRLIKQEGIDSISKKNKIKSELIYSEIDRNKCFSGFSEVSDRSQMNATFNMKEGFDSELFNKICSNNKISGINGHRSVGGYRASIYNALSLDSLNVLVDSMKEFELSQE